MYTYVIWFIIAVSFTRIFVSSSEVTSYIKNSSNHSNQTCPKNCSEVEFKLLPISINFEHIEVYLLVTIFILIAILAKLVWHLSKLEKFTSNFPESCMLIILGIAFGYVYIRMITPLS